MKKHRNKFAEPRGSAYWIKYCSHIWTGNKTLNVLLCRAMSQLMRARTDQHCKNISLPSLDFVYLKFISLTSSARKRKYINWSSSNVWDIKLPSVRYMSTDISEKRVTSNFRVKRYAKQETSTRQVASSETFYSETSVTWRIPEEGIVLNHLCENFASYDMKVLGW
jgi:hypothetical protein